jgi:hypothetical protein
LIIDQFEEALILSNEETKADLRKLLTALNSAPISGLLVLLSLRAEYLNDVIDLGLPGPAFGARENAFEVRPFSRAAAQDFIESSGLKLGDKLVQTTLHEAAEIEDMPDRVRPIVLNMLGLVIASFKGALPKGVEAGRLLRGYAQRSIDAPAVRGTATKVLRPLITSLGTKRALSTEQIAGAAQLSPLTVRGCLVSLANDGLVRRLPGDEEQWEVAHDFVARLLQPIVMNWRASAWKLMAPWALPLSVGIWSVAIVAAAIFHPTLREDYLLSDLRSVGLVPGPDKEGGKSFLQNGEEIHDQEKFWSVSKDLDKLPYPIVALSARSKDLTSLVGMPALAHLKDLNLTGTAITTLTGMPILTELIKLKLEVANEDLTGLPVEPKLSTFFISSPRLRSLNNFPVMPNLSKLTIVNLPTDTSVNAASLSLNNLPLLPNLSNITLVMFSKITDLSRLAALPKLNTLSVYCAYNSDPEFPPLPKLNSLTRLQDVYIVVTLDYLPILLN